MKKTFTFFTVIILFSATIFGQKQENKIISKTSKVESKKSIDYKKEYYIQEHKLKSCFLNGKIPRDFPKGSNFSTKERYKAAILNYIKDNPNLLVASEVKKYENHIQKIVSQPTISEQKIKEERLDAYKRKTPRTQEEIQQRELKQQQLNKK